MSAVAVDFKWLPNVPNIQR